MKVRLITRSQIHPDPEQPRQAADAELRNSIARNGLLQPITVRPHPTILTEWMIVDGERRWRSCEGVLEDLPCIVRGDMDELARRLATQLEANTGKPLTALEEARAFLQVVQATGMNVADLAELHRAAEVDDRRAARDPRSRPVGAAHRVRRRRAVARGEGAAAAAHGAGHVHEHAIELLKKDYRFEKKGQGRGISLGDFENLIQQFYAPSMYPLTKSKSSWAKQPEFKTTAHADECDCGGIKFDLGGSGGGDRLCCGNPAGGGRCTGRRSRRRSRPRIRPSRGGRCCTSPRPRSTSSRITTATCRAASRSSPTATACGTSAVATGRPSILPISRSTTRSSSPGRATDRAIPCVGTRDAAAVKAARAKWDARWSTERTKLVEKLRAEIEPRLPAFRLVGAALATIGGLLNSDGARRSRSTSPRRSAGHPEQRHERQSWNQHPRTAKWIESLTPQSASNLLTAIAIFVEQKLKLPSARIEQLQQSAIGNIAKRPIPWLAKPKAAAGKKAAPTKKGKRADKEVPLGKLSAETAELPLDEEDDLWDSGAGDVEDADELEEATG
jgi:ParB-like chromosome segregation protein Spo0J